MHLIRILVLIEAEAEIALDILDLLRLLLLEIRWKQWLRHYKFALLGRER